MTNDARFEDAGEQALRLRALDADDLTVMSGLLQDAVLVSADMSFRKSERRFALLVNRVRWEHDGASAERVRSMVVIEDALSVKTQGISRGDGDMVLSLLSVRFDAGEAPGGTIYLTFAGDGEIAVTVEALEVLVQDVTRPYEAVSGRLPTHD